MCTRRDARDPPFRVRQTPEWKNHAAKLEREMLRRRMTFEVIDWIDSPARPRGSRARAGALFHMTEPVDHPITGPQLNRMVIEQRLRDHRGR